MLEAKELSVYYGKRPVLHGLSFTVEKGSVTALLGLNGSGKSTLLSAIGGALPYEGSLLFEGVPLACLSPRERAVRLSLLPQILPTPPFTVAETVLCGREPYLTLAHRPSSEDARIADEAMALTGIAPLRERRLSSLSGGERQMAFLAMTLAQKAPLLLLDEPTSFLDKVKEKHFLSTLAAARQKEGLTVLAAMHDITAAMRFADRFLILGGGKLLFDGEREALLRTELVEKTFGVRRYDTPDGPVFV